MASVTAGLGDETVCHPQARFFFAVKGRLTGGIFLILIEILLLICPREAQWKRRDQEEDYDSD